jgi:hypothetical protein
MSGIWYEGTHSECVVQGRHRHDIDGSIFFVSIGSVMETICRMQGESVELWRVAAAMQRGQQGKWLDSSAQESNCLGDILVYDVQRSKTVAMVPFSCLYQNQT